MSEVDPTARTLDDFDTHAAQETVVSLNLPSPFKAFDPQTIIERVGSGSAVIHQVFGTGVSFGKAESDAFDWAEIPLWELRRDRNGEQWIDHGMPADTSSVASARP